MRGREAGMLRESRISFPWRRVICLCAVIGMAAGAVPAWAEPTPAAAAVSDAPGEVGVIVVLERLGSMAPAAADEPLQAWLERFAAELSLAPGPHPPVDVKGGVVLERGLLSAQAGADREPALRDRARDAGARYAVSLGITRLAGSYGIDVALLAARGGPRLGHGVFDAEGPDGLVATLARAATAVRGFVERAEALPADPALSADQQNGAALTPPADGEGRIAEIRIAGSRRIEADAVRAQLATRAGDPLSEERIREDIRRIYKLGFFRDVQVTTTSAGPGGEGEAAPGGTIVTFHVEENPIIRRVSVSGNDSLGPEDIKEHLTISVGSTIDYPLLIENKRRIKGLYAAQGYYLAEVEYAVEPLGQDAVAIDFEISEGKKLRLVEVDFEGNERFTDDDLLKHVDTKTWSWHSRVSHFWTNAGVYAEPVFYQDLDKIQRFYMDHGFIRVRVGEPQVDHDADGLRVRVPIDEGLEYHVGTVDVEGDATMDREELLGLVTLEPGEVFRRSAMTTDVEQLQTHYADRGFFFANVDPLTRVDPDTQTVDCSFQVEKGDLYFVDRIEVHGNTRTRDTVVRREIALGEGELFSADALDRSRARVRRLGFFEEVNVEAKPADDSRRLNLDVDVVERPTGTFSFGAGFGSTDGFLLNASIQQENLFGRAYGLAASADLGQDNQSAYLAFSNPAWFGSSLSFSTKLSMLDRDFIDFDQEIMGFDVSIGYPLDEGETRAFTGYSFTSRDITGLDVQASSMLQREEFEEETTTSLLSLSARRDTRDDPRFPKTGHVTGFAFEFAGLGGLSEFARLEGRTTWFLPAKKWLGFESTFVVNSRVGYTIPFNDISDFDLPDCDGCDFSGTDMTQVQPLTNIDTDLELPLSERYFLGGVGAFQVRGFKQRSLGPRRSILDQSGVGGDKRKFYTTGRNVSGTCITPSGVCNDLLDTDIDDFEDLDLTDVVGGNKMLLLNLELQFPLSEELGLMGIVFFDMGNAFAENESINPADLRFGTGAGLQWFSPFGPILVQLGVPLDRLEDEDATVFEFSLGGSSY